MGKVLVVDDNEVDREHIRRLLGSDYEIIEAATVQAAGKQLEAGGIECVLLDQRLPDGDGIGLLATLVEHRLPVLMLTAQGNEQLAVQALKGGARDYIAKSKLSPEVLQRSVAHAIERGRLELELLAHQERLAASNQALAEREAQLRVVLSQLPAVVWTTTLDLRYASVDGAALSALGVAGAELVGRDVRGGVPGATADGTHEDIEALHRHRCAVAGESARYTCSARGRAYECLAEPLRGQDGVICGTIGVALDVTEGRRLEAELRHSQKLEAIGMLASGVAHELNTPIQYVGDNVSFLSRAFTLLSPTLALAIEQAPDRAARGALEFVRENLSCALDSVADGCQRVAEIVGAMKGFAHPDGGGFATADINRALNGTVVIARNVVKYVAEVQLELGDLPPVECRIGELNQVFLNLIINAAHAIADKPRPSGDLGVIRLSTRVRDERVIVEVQDDGTGIPEAIQGRIFEPFFTTKEVGRGTGQGLAISRAILRDKHGGDLRFVSTPGVGTTFIVEIPLERQALSSSEASPHSLVTSNHPVASAGLEVA
jgi:two-component system NtrC family sensor kinase